MQQFTGPLARAFRFPVRIAVPFRPCGADSPWMEGFSVNVSRTGLLLEADSPMAVGTALEIVLEFAPPLAKVFCTGCVVRTALAPTRVWTVALTIERYRVVQR